VVEIGSPKDPPTGASPAPAAEDVYAEIGAMVEGFGEGSSDPRVYVFRVKPGADCSPNDPVHVATWRWQDVAEDLPRLLAELVPPPHRDAKFQLNIKRGRLAIVSRRLVVAAPPERSVAAAVENPSVADLRRELQELRQVFERGATERGQQRMTVKEFTELASALRPPERGGTLADAMQVLRDAMEIAGTMPPGTGKKGRESDGEGWQVLAELARAFMQRPPAPAPAAPARPMIAGPPPAAPTSPPDLFAGNAGNAGNQEEAVFATIARYALAGDDPGFWGEYLARFNPALQASDFARYANRPEVAGVSGEWWRDLLAAYQFAASPDTSPDDAAPSGDTPPTAPPAGGVTDAT